MTELFFVSSTLPLLSNTPITAIFPPLTIATSSQIRTTRSAHVASKTLRIKSTNNKPLGKSTNSKSSVRWPIQRFRQSCVIRSSTTSSRTCRNTPKTSKDTSQTPTLLPRSKSSLHRESWEHLLPRSKRWTLLQKGARARTRDYSQLFRAYRTHLILSNKLKNYLK